MAYTMREAARYLQEDAQQGISWIALWKDGRGWGFDTFYLEEKQDGTVELDHPEDIENLQRILATDPHAIIVNSWVHNLGVFEEYVSRDHLGKMLRWQYENQTFTLADFIECIVQPEQDPAAHGAQIAPDEMAECTKTEEPTEDATPWADRERTVTLTNAQWNRLGTYLAMTTKHREGELIAWQNLASEKNQDGTPLFANAASNAEYWQGMVDDIETMRQIIDAV